MKMNCILKHILFLIPAFSFSKAFTQAKDLGNEENKLIGIHHQISSRLNTSLSRRFDSPDFYKDSVAYFITALDREFTNLITNNPKTIDYPFNKLVDSHLCKITTSFDGKMRVYNLDSWQLLTEIVQWKGRDNVFTRVSRYVKDSSVLCREIFAVQLNGKRYYLPVTSTIIWPAHARQSVAAWHIKGSSLEAVSLFKNRSGKLDHIDVPFSFYNFAPKIKDSLLTFISYDDIQKKIYIPCVNDKGVFTQRYFIYELKKDCLEFTNTGPHR
jgi:hypothetical protein